MTPAAVTPRKWRRVTVRLAPAALRPRSTFLPPESVAQDGKGFCPAAESESKCGIVVRGRGRRVQRQGCGGQVSHKSCAVPRLGQRGLEISLCLLCTEHRERNARERQREA